MSTVWEDNEISPGELRDALTGAHVERVRAAMTAPPSAPVRVASEASFGSDDAARAVMQVNLDAWAETWGSMMSFFERYQRWRRIPPWPWWNTPIGWAVTGWICWRVWRGR